VKIQGVRDRHFALPSAKKSEIRKCIKKDQQDNNYVMVFLAS